jgi:hypothetical protein
MHSNGAYHEELKIQDSIINWTLLAISQRHSHAVLKRPVESRLENVVYTRAQQWRSFALKLPHASTRDERRADSQAEYSVLRAQYDALPTDKRMLIKTEFAAQKAGNPAINWSRFLAVALPIVQAQ